MLRGSFPRVAVTLKTATVFSWAPLAIGFVYLCIFVAKFPQLVKRVYWDSDAASAALLSQSLGHGTVAIDRYGYFLSMAFAVATRSLPYHRQLWEVVPYCVAIGSVGVLVTASWHFAGRWAAAMTAVVGVATSPFVNYDRITLNYHAPTFLAVVVLAGFSVWLVREKSRRRAVAVAALIGALAGISSRTDCSHSSACSHTS